MKITLDIPLTSSCLFLNLIYHDEDFYEHKESKILYIKDLYEGAEIKWPHGEKND